MNDDKLMLRLAKKSLPQCKKKAKDEFQKWIRIRDKDLPCISCGKFITEDGLDMKWDGGHFYKSELYTSLMFDEGNCHKQCSYCNDHLSGNLIEYRDRLLIKIGQEGYEDLRHASSLDKQVDPFNGKPAKLYYIEKFLEYKNKLKEEK